MISKTIEPPNGMFLTLSPSHFSHSLTSLTLSPSHSLIMTFNQKICSTFFLATLFIFASCRKSGEEIIALLSETEAAEILETSVSAKMAGFTMPTVDMAQILENYLNSCNVPGDTSLQKSKTAVGATYNYTFNMDWLVTCSNLGVPQSAAVGIAGNGTFSSPHWSGSDVTVGELVFTGLSPQEPAYIVNGTYELEGDLTGNLRRVDPTLNCVTELNISNLTISKSSYQVTGGSGTAKITGSSNGRQQTLNGVLTFHADGTVTVTVNGHTHDF